MVAVSAGYLFFIASTIIEVSHGLNVQAGDTLASIAAKSGVSVDALQAANAGLNANDMQINQVINVPNSSPAPVAGPPPASSTPAPAPAPAPAAGPPAPAPVPAIMSVGNPSCAPSPIGKYADATHVGKETGSFCDKNGHLTYAQLVGPPYNGLLDGDWQVHNVDHGNGGLSSNEKGYNLTISAIPNCAYPDGSAYSVGQPMGPANVNSYCKALMLTSWRECEYLTPLYLE